MEPGFNIKYQGRICPVERLQVNSTIVFKVKIEGMAPVMITKATKQDGVEFWTSIPEGQQKLAVILGRLVDEHLKTNQQSLF